MVPTRRPGRPRGTLVAARTGDLGDERHGELMGVPRPFQDPRLDPASAALGSFIPPGEVAPATQPLAPHLGAAAVLAGPGRHRERWYS